MGVQCFTWIPYLWGRLVDSFIAHKGVVRRLPDDTIIDAQLVDSFTVHKGVVTPLPNDIVLHILSRLPAESVLTCQVVCKNWRALTSTAYFAELHLIRSTPVSLIQNIKFGTMNKNELDLLIYDEKARKDKMMKKIRIGFANVVQQNWLVLVGSCNGLLLFQPRCFIPIFYVCNPIIREQMTLRPPVKRVQCCGFFFHPISKEYRLLCLHNQGNCFGYTIYSLGSKLWRDLTTFPYRPKSSIAPAIVNGALHWILKHKYEPEIKKPSCSNSIMVFNMDKEDFHSMPHPKYKCLPWLNNEISNLLEMREQLALCHLSGQFIEIWILEDYANWIWVKCYEVDIGWDLYKFAEDAFSLKRKKKFVNIQNDGLLLDWYRRGFYRHLLKRRYFCSSLFQLKDIHEMLNKYWETTTYTKSFISLRGFPEARI